MAETAAQGVKYKQGREAGRKKGPGFESGWYIPGIVDPEVKKRELKDEEERLALPADQFYELLEHLTSEQSESEVDDVRGTSGSSGQIAT